MIEKSKGEKKLLSLINAAVSHEMRTPINSIMSQNVQLKHLIGRLSELLAEGHRDLAVFKDKLRLVRNELSLTYDITSRSTKCLVFVVNDMLDLGQLTSSKFRKVITKFNVKTSIEEIISVLDFKAKQMKVQVEIHMENFPGLSCSTD